MKRNYLFFLLITCMILSFLPFQMAANANQQTFIYDYAELLTNDEIKQLESLSSELSKERETAFIIITADGTDGKSIKKYVQDFYDKQAVGYDQPHGNAAILTIDMQERDIYLSGFKKAEEYLNNSRLDVIRSQISPDLSDARYFDAFSGFIKKAASSMETGVEAAAGPAGVQTEDNGQTDSSNASVYENEVVNGEKAETKNIFFEWWFQLIISVVLAGITVLLMMAGTGGRITASGSTYMDQRKTRVLNEYDRYVRKTVTKTKKPSADNNNNSSGGGGITLGGHSHSGSKGKF
ncbi:TPM domain-containing protein [Cytobacillus purgationiresistens]|uniref:TPM domain-containing protein n=1 Tax=Cytobacillus purgationiresistens TaxID=863449 RepID=A0ABU0AMN3_9BACI|nr:TPM domain-containing protein [Cytobacillus purgationiresistens]MDQ0272134.1 uncharacterized protein [Cytobacillus purgationiresistens]